MTALDMDVNMKKDAKANQKGRKDKMYLAPILYATGISISKVDQFIVYFSNTKYMFKDPVEALLCCFAMHFAFGLKYQSECYEVWQLLQLAFFNIEITDKDEKRNLSDEVDNYVRYFLKE